MGTKISAFPSMTALQGTELILGDQSGATGTTTPTAVAAYLAGLATTPVLASYARTAAEIAAGVTPTNYAYAPGYVERYGADPTGTNDSGPAFRSACAVASSAGGGVIYALGASYLFNTWDTTSFYSTNNLALFLLPANTELVGGGEFYTKLIISQTARTGMYDAGANRTHIIGMSTGATGQYIHDLWFDFDGIVQAAANDYVYCLRTMSGGCIIERCYTVQAPITNAIADSSGNTGLPVIVRNCWMQDSGPNMTNNTVNADCSYIYLSAPGSRAEHNRLFNSANALHNCGGIEMHCSQYYATNNFLKNLWPAMYIGVEDGVTISAGSRISGNYIGYNNSGISFVDQHTGLKITGNYFEANCDSAGTGFGYLFTDIFTPLDSTTGINFAGVQTATLITGNVFNCALFRDGTSRSSGGSTSTFTTSANFTSVLGLEISRNIYIEPTPTVIEIQGSVTSPTQNVSIWGNQFINCIDASSGTSGFVYVNNYSGSGWASGPIIQSVYVRDNNLWRSLSYSMSIAGAGLIGAGGPGPAPTTIDISFSHNELVNVHDVIVGSGLGASVTVNGLAVDSTQSITANGATISTSVASGITTTGVAVLRIVANGAYTGIILEAGTVSAQTCVVINESAAADSLTMAATGSNVADGSSCVIDGLTQKTFVWDTATALWYHS